MATPRVHELFAQVMSGRFVPDTSHEWSILVLTPQSLSIDIPDSCKQAKYVFHLLRYTMNRNGNFGLVLDWGEILLRYMIFAYHWTF